MGRTKKSRKKHRPVKGQEDKKKIELALHHGEKERMQSLLTLVEGQEYDVDVVYALATLSGFVAEPKGSKLFCKLHGLSKLSFCYLHTNIEIREKVFGVVSNYLITGEDEALGDIVNHNVPDSLLTVFNQFVSRMSMTDNITTAELNLLDQLLQLCTLLCESSPTVMHSLDGDFLFTFLVSLIQQTTFPVRLRCVAAKCMYTLSEENQTFTNLASNSPELRNVLLPIIPDENDDKLLLSLLCSGVLLNLADGQPDSHTSEVKERCVKIASRCLDLQHSSLQMEDTINVLHTQQVALEMLANILCVKVDDWQDVESDDDTGDDVICDDFKDDITTGVQRETLQLMINCDIPNKVVAKCRKLSEGKVEHAIVQKSLLTTCSRCWQCLSNLVTNAPAEMLCGMEQSLWEMLQKSTFNENGELRNEHPDVLDASACAMRAIVEKLLSSQPDTVCCLATVVMVMKMLERGPSETSQMNLLRVLGMIGKVMSSRDSSEQLLLKIGEILTSFLRSSPTLVAQSEAVDAALDVFADGPHVDHVLQSTQLFEVLKKTSATFKAKIRSERHLLVEHYSVVDMARTNLRRFIGYKGNM